jgi:anti-sigma factor RsiW
MGHIIRLHGDRHHDIQLLLPWYVTGQLDEAERAAVDAHLAACSECQADLNIERRLQQKVVALPLDVARGWNAMQQQLDQPVAAVPTAHNTRPGVARRGASGWLVAAQIAALVATGAVVLPLARSGNYHALGSPHVQPSGNILVIFRPDASEAEIRGLLQSSGARLVDGPTPAGAYVLSAPAAARTTSLAKLAADSRVVMAQPIDATGAP